MNGRSSQLTATSVVSASLLIFAIAEIYAASRLSVTEDYTLGPGALPIIYSVGLFIFSGISLFESISRAPKSKLEGGNYRYGILCVSFLLMFIASIYVIGFLLATILFCALFCFFISEMGIVRSFIFSVLWGGTVYAVFYYLLQIPLEAGFLFS